MFKYKKIRHGLQRTQTRMFDVVKCNSNAAFAVMVPKILKPYFYSSKNLMCQVPLLLQMNKKFIKNTLFEI